MSLTKQTDETGGIVVVPESWKYHNELTERARAHWGSDEDAQFLLVPPSDEILKKMQPIFLHVDPGDVSEISNSLFKFFYILNTVCIANKILNLYSRLKFLINHRWCSGIQELCIVIQMLKKNSIIF